MRVTIMVMRRGRLGSPISRINVLQQTPQSVQGTQIAHGSWTAAIGKTAVALQKWTRS
jgi:hypothetical protein